jgi:hypothetical protein
LGSSNCLNVYSADTMFEKYIKQYNDCFADLPADMHVGVHLGGVHVQRVLLEASEELIRAEI